MSNHTPPIVPVVLVVAEQRHPWKLAAIERFETTYHTATTVRVADPTGALTKQQAHVYCLPDDAAYTDAEACRAVLQSAIDRLADELRTLGSYAQRLVEAGGERHAPNPLTPWVIEARDPDQDNGWIFCHAVPQVARHAIVGHTPKMLLRAEPYAHKVNQHDHFVCPDDAAWQRVEALHRAAEQAASDWETLKRRLGTYSEALGDGRYTKKDEEAMDTPAGLDVDQELIAQLGSAGWRWVGAEKQTDGRLLHTVTLDGTGVRQQLGVGGLRNLLALANIRADAAAAVATAESAPAPVEPPSEVTDAPPAFGGRHFESYAQAGNNALIPLADIRTDGGTQARAALDPATVAEYRDLYAAGVPLPPVVLFYDGESYWLADGFHRVAASDPATYPAYAIAADVRQGTRRDAVLYAAGANATHGLRRTNADKRRAVETLLRDDEWRQWSDREIARRACVSDKTVAALRKELTAEIPQSTERRGADGRTIDTAAIGAKAPAQSSVPAEPDPRFADAQQRFAALGWRLGMYGLWYKLTKPNGEHYATTPDLGPQINTLEHFEAGARRRAAESTPAAGWTCAICGKPQTAMKEPSPPHCTTCVMLRVAQRAEPNQTDPVAPPVVAELVDRAATEIGAANRDNPAWQADARPADALREQATTRMAALLRTGFAVLRSETIVLRLLALGICGRDQRALISDMPLDQLHDLLIGRIVAGAWSGDAGPLLALLKIESAVASASVSSSPAADPLAPIRRHLARLRPVLAHEDLWPEEITDASAQLARLMDELEALADAPDVDDDAYYALSRQIGDARRSLTEQAESEVAV